MKNLAKTTAAAVLLMASNPMTIQGRIEAADKSVGMAKGITAACKEGANERSAHYLLASRLYEFAANAYGATLQPALAAPCYEAACLCIDASRIA